MFADIFKNRLIIGGIVFFVLCVGGSLLYQRLATNPALIHPLSGPELFSTLTAPPELARQLTGEPPPASLVDVPVAAPPPKVARPPEVLNEIIDAAVDRDLNFAQAGRFEALCQIMDEAVANGEFPRDERLSQLRIILKRAVANGEISSEEGEDISSRYNAMLQTEGMSAWEAAQYFDRNGSPSRAYTKELAAQALVEDPDDPERLFFWAKRQDFVPRGSNPEREAAYEKLVARDDLPDKLRSRILDSFAGTIWWNRPEEAIRYRQEAAALSDNSNYDLIGVAYQRLGQYHKALAIHREYYAKTRSWGAAGHIRAIEEGKPLIPAIQRESASPPAALDTGTSTPAPGGSRGSE